MSSTAFGTIIELMDTIGDTIPGLNFFDPSWNPWRAILKAVYGLEMTEAELALYRELTGRTDPPDAQVAEAWLLCGRRAGKSYIISLIAIYQACFRDWSPYLKPGERAVAMLAAADRPQAKGMFSYIVGMISTVPMLDAMVARDEHGRKKITKEEIELSNGITIVCSTASYRTIRGRTVICALLDEICFWMTSETSLNPDTEIVKAIRPGMASVPGAILLAASSTYARRGIAYTMWDRYHGQKGEHSDVLVIQAATRQLNPTIPQSTVDRDIAEDPDLARTEWLGLWRDDVSGFISREVAWHLVMQGVTELPPQPGSSYAMFVDAAGGSGQDSFAAAVSHRESDGTMVLDALYERKPKFDPKNTVFEVSQLAKRYGITKVTGDRWASGFVEAAFKDNGIMYEPSEKSASDIYREIEPFLSVDLANPGKLKVRLLHDDRLINQLVSLEKRTMPSGKDQVSHPPGAHDDRVNAACGALLLVGQSSTMATWHKLNDRLRNGGGMSLYGNNYHPIFGWF